MIPLAIGLGVLGFIAMRRAHRHGRCHGGSRGWHGPWGPSRHHRHHGGRRRWMLHAALARIDATPAQERVIVHELDALESRVHGAKANLREVRGDLAAALRGPTLDDAALGGVLGRVDTTTGDVRTAAIEALRNIHAVLDDNQRAAFADLLEGGWRGSWRGGGWRDGSPYR